MKAVLNGGPCALEHFVDVPFVDPDPGHEQLEEEFGVALLDGDDDLLRIEQHLPDFVQLVGLGDDLARIFEQPDLSLVLDHTEITLHDFNVPEELLELDILDFGVPGVEEVLRKVVDFDLLLSCLVPLNREDIRLNALCQLLHGELLFLLLFVQQLLQVVLEVGVHEDPGLSGEHLLLILDLDAFEDILRKLPPVHIGPLPQFDKAGVLAFRDVVQVLILLVEVDEFPPHGEGFSPHLDRVQHPQVLDLL